MKSIAVINQKGGVGKTTTAVNLSAALADRGQTVWLMDLDPQAHASLHLGVSLNEDDASLYDVLVDDLPLMSVLRPVRERLSLIPSHVNLAAAEIELVSRPGREHILNKQIRGLETPPEFLIIDCPPSLGLLTINALTSVEDIILPMQPHYLSLHGLSKILQSIELVSNALNPSLRLEGILFCLFDTGTRLAEEVVHDVESFFESSADGKPWSGSHPFQSRIRRNIRLAEAPSFGQSVFEYAPSSNGAADYSALAEELLARYCGRLARPRLRVA